MATARVSLASGTSVSLIDTTQLVLALITSWDFGPEERLPPNPVLEKDGKTREFEGLTPDILTDHAIEFIGETANGNEQKPFLLALHFRAPHARWLPVADEDWTPFESLDPTLHIRTTPTLTSSASSA